MAYSVEQLAALEEIKDLAKFYCRGVDRLDAAVMKRAYWPDAYEDHGPFKGNAMDYIDMCMQVHDFWCRTMHCIFNHSIEFDDDGVHARGEIYNVTYMFRAESPEMDTFYTRYLDRYEKRDGEWRIIKRVATMEGNTTGSIKAVDLPADDFVAGDFDRRAIGRPIGP